MNFKRNLFIITTALVGALSLSGCDFGNRNKFVHFEFIQEVEDKHQDVSFEGYKKYGDYYHYKVLNNSGEELDLGDAYHVIRDYGYGGHLKSIGEQKIIVVPVDFPDYKVEKLGLTEEQYIDNLNKTFFGNAKNNSYISVGEYFNKSSYGKLKLDGKVCDKFFTFPLSSHEIKERQYKSEDLADFYKNVLDWYKQNYDDIDQYQIEGLKTGKNIPIYMVYTYPSTSPDDFFWAYTFSNIPLSWSSSSFMYLEYGTPDSHTYIHETGHLLGLKDYYPKQSDDESLFVPDPAGRIDMMDCSIGDETSFSKMMLNWVRPTYVFDSCELTLNSFTETGDVILLANNWNNTPFDEYYLFEFYTPTNLNTYDISVGNSEARLPKVPGIKIYHVDSRLAYFVNNSIQSYCDYLSTAPNSFNIELAHDNNTYKDPNEYQKNYLYSLVLNHEFSMKSGAAVDSNLFRFGDDIPVLQLNKNEELKFSITITESSFDSAKIKFEKI